MKDHANNLDSFLLHSFFTPFILHSYGSSCFLCREWFRPIFREISITLRLELIQLWSSKAWIVVLGNSLGPKSGVMSFCMPHRLCTSRIKLCNNLKLDSFQFDLQSFGHSSQNCNRHLHLQLIWQLVNTNIHRIIYNQCINNAGDILSLRLKCIISSKWFAFGNVLH